MRELKKLQLQEGGLPAETQDREQELHALQSGTLANVDT